MAFDLMADQVHTRQPCLPALGRIVLYLPYGRRSPVPAIVMATPESLHPDDVDSGEVPMLSDAGRLHLAVLGAAARRGSPAIASAEYDVPEDHATGSSPNHYTTLTQTAGCWRWPPLR